MDLSYDIFLRVGDAGPPLWIESVTSLEEAKQRLAVLSSQERGTYMVFDWCLGTFIEHLGSLRSNPLATSHGGSLLVHN